MDYYPDEASSASLITTEDDDATTVHGNGTAASASSSMQVAHRGMLGDCDCESLCCQSKDLQLPATSKTIYESWTITYHRVILRIKNQTNILPCTWWLTFEREPGHVMAIEPQTHFGQEELCTVVSCAREQHKPRALLAPRSYDEDVELRLRKLDLPVQNELYKLLRDRTANASNSFRRREYKLAVLVEVPGGEVTDAGSQPRRKERWVDRLRMGKKPKAPLVEYRLILRGEEVRSNDAGWGAYDRYSQPWKLADEAELANAREKSGYQKVMG